MSTALVTYVVEREPGHGWTVLRDDAPIGRRHLLVSAIELATLLAESEARQGARSTQVLMKRGDCYRLPGYQPWSSAA